MEKSSSINETLLTTLIKHGSKVTFSWYDYILFSVMLLCSAVIGIYFGCFGSKQSTTNEYLMGGKTMKVIPIAISLVASHTSGITLLALPADVYQYGAAYWLGSISMGFLCAITIYVYLPVFFNLQITSTYQYLELRFDNRTRLFASFLYALSLLLYLPIVIYIPALAFSAATGVNVHSITPIVCGICIFYTTIGGLKAVVWTDTLQFTFTVGAVGTVLALGIKSAGGFLEVWDKAVDGGRLDIFDFDIDPTKRDTVWMIWIGLTVTWLGHTAVSQSCIQKFLSVPTLHDANLTVIYYGIGMNILKTTSVLTGFVMYAKYSNCDPFTTKEVTKNDQLLPYYVMDVARNIPGLSGLFIAGIFSAALSTLSASLNCLGATIYEDFVSKCLDKKTTQKTASNILKLIVIIAGVVCTASVFIIEHLGGLLPLAISLSGVTNGPLVGLFTFGLLFPRGNAKGAFYGSIIGLVFMIWVVFVAKYYEAQGLFKHEPKPLSTDGCEFLNLTTPFIQPLNETSNQTTNFHVSKTINSVTENFSSNESFRLDVNNSIPGVVNSTTSGTYQPFFLFRISYYYYTLLGSFMTILCGLIISYLSKPDEPSVKEELISPVARFLLPKRPKHNGNGLPYASVEKALHIVAKNSGKENEEEN